MFPLKSISYIAYCVDCGRKGAFCTFAGSDSIPFAGKSCHRMIGMPFQIVEVKLLGRIKTYEKIFDLLPNNNFLSRMCHSGIF